jgi:hypothetical protein
MIISIVNHSNGQVTDFLLPLYVTGTRDTDEVAARNDFLGRGVSSST